jgi:carbon monoxide dehydrogenase subunit G
MRHRGETTWRVAAPPDDIWKILADYDEWPAWWPAVRSVELLDQGDEQGIGSVLRQRWRGVIPYTLTFDLAMSRIQRPRILAGRASGALEGTCEWRLEELAEGTLVRFDVDVRTTPWWMGLPLPFGDRVFAAVFRAILGTGRRGLERRLGVSVVEQAPGAPVQARGATGSATG